MSVGKQQVVNCESNMNKNHFMLRIPLNAQYVYERNYTYFIMLHR